MNEPIPTPRYSGFRGAALYGLLLVIFGSLIPVICGVMTWFLTHNENATWFVCERFVFFWIPTVLAAVLGRWICRASWNRMLGMSPVLGDVGSLIGLVVGMAIAGSTLSGPILEFETNPNSLPLGQQIDLIGPTLSRKPFDVADYRGKVVLIDFWATWCHPCIAELPNLKSVYEQYHPEGLEVVSISLDFARENLVQYLDREPLPWTNIFFEEENQSGFQNPIAQKLGVNSIPRAMLLDREGKLIGDNLRGEDLETAVAEQFEGSLPFGTRILHRLRKVPFWLLLAYFKAPLFSLLLATIPTVVAGALIEKEIRNRNRRRATSKSNPT